MRLVLAERVVGVGVGVGFRLREGLRARPSGDVAVSALPERLHAPLLVVYLAQLEDVTGHDDAFIYATQGPKRQTK